MMGFSLVCPVDGPVDVTISDITSIVVRGGDDVDVVFECPRCGAAIQVNAKVPRVLLASLDEVVVADEENGEIRVKVSAVLHEAGQGASVGPDAQPDAADQERIERYCEYFRRQLEAARSAEAMLEEIDSR
jgi:hypothetical protein